jgi:hypothetical protein
MFSASAQTLIFKEGDTVQTPDGRTGKIESFKDQEMAKVRFGSGASETQYFMLKDLKVVKAPKTEPIETFRVGDLVKAPKFPEGRIISINGDKATIRFGNGRYDTGVELLENLISPQALAAKTERENAGKLVRAQFEDEAKPFLILVRTLAFAYNPKYRMEISFRDEPATYQKFSKELDALYAVCQKYPNLTNPADARENNINQNMGDWCKMAEQRTAVIKRLKTAVGDQSANATINSWKLKIDEKLRNWNGYVKDDLQMLLYDRTAWEQKELASAAKKYADVGEKMPPDLLASLDEKVAELKAKIEEDAQTRHWTQPDYKDAAFEAIVRSAYPKQFPGVKVYKTGMTYATWKAEDDTSLVGSGTGYKVYRTTKDAYRFKLGLALVKLPNQPLCQIRDFEFHQDKTGAGYSAAKLYLPLGYTGIFVKCP